MKPSRVLGWLGMAVVLLWGAYRVYLARADLVTLNVHDMEVRRVVRKMEWQTWESILLNTNVNGKITLNVRRVPLTEVLNIIALQTSSRWTALYPIYSAARSTTKLEKVVRGEIPAAGSGWSNLEKAPGWKNGGGSAFGNAVRSANDLVSAQIENKDLDFAALALSRFAQAQVVPEDGASGTINLKLDQAPFAKAVSLVAKQAHRKWDKLFTLQPRRGIMLAMKGPPPGNDTNVVVKTEAEGGNVVKTDVVRTEVFQKPPANDPAEQQRRTEAFLSTMTPQERSQAEAQLATMQEISSLPQAERQQRMQEMAAQAQQTSQADLEQRVRKRLRDGTPNQRIAHDRELLNRQQQRQKQ